MSTSGMAKNLADRLEALSGYRHVFAPNDPNAGLNPVVYSHLRITVGGMPLHVLSRVCAAGLDYTQRSNKFAHHVVLDQKELVPAGPAAVLATSGFMEATWEGEPRVVGLGRKPPRLEAPAAICRTWEKVTGDAGWAGVLAETAVAGPSRVATVIFQPGMDTLALVAEALALLPDKLRWQVTFSTYYTKLPPEVQCQWRFALQGSPEAKAAQRSPQMVTIDLTSQLSPAADSPWVVAARTGKAPRQAVEAAQVAVQQTASPLPQTLSPIATAGNPNEGYELDLGSYRDGASHSIPRLPSMRFSRKEKSSRSAGKLFAVVAVLSLLLGAGAYFSLKTLWQDYAKVVSTEQLAAEAKPELPAEKPDQGLANSAAITPTDPAPTDPAPTDPAPPAPTDPAPPAPTDPAPPAPTDPAPPAPTDPAPPAPTDPALTPTSDASRIIIADSPVTGSAIIVDQPLALTPPPHYTSQGPVWDKPQYFALPPSEKPTAIWLTNNQMGTSGWNFELRPSTDPSNENTFEIWATRNPGGSPKKQQLQVAHIRVNSGQVEFMWAIPRKQVDSKVVGSLRNCLLGVSMSSSHFGFPLRDPEKLDPIKVDLNKETTKVTLGIDSLPKSNFYLNVLLPHAWAGRGYVVGPVGEGPTKKVATSTQQRLPELVVKIDKPKNGSDTLVLEWTYKLRYASQESAKGYVYTLSNLNSRHNELVSLINQFDPPNKSALGKPNLSPKDLEELDKAKEEVPKLKKLIDECKELQKVSLSYEIWADLGTHRLLLGRAIP
jgi:hypothetical protein